MRDRGTAAVLMLLLFAVPPVRLSAQGEVERLALRFASMTAVTGLEQAMVDSLRALFPGSARDRAFDQQLEGHRVTVFGAKAAVPGVVAVKSTHLTRGRGAPGAPEPTFTVDNAYVDVGASSAAEVQALGIALLAPVSLAKRPHLYGERLLAAPDAARRAACAALAAAVQAQPRVRGTVVVAFTVQSLYTSNAGLASLKALLGPFDDIKIAALPARYPDTAVETVGLADVDRLAREIVQWMEGR